MISEMETIALVAPKTSRIRQPAGVKSTEDASPKAACDNSFVPHQTQRMVGNKCHRILDSQCDDSLLELFKPDAAVSSLSIIEPVCSESLTIAHLLEQSLTPDSTTACSVRKELVTSNEADVSCNLSHGILPKHDGTELHSLNPICVNAAQSSSSDHELYPLQMHSDSSDSEGSHHVEDCRAGLNATNVCSISTANCMEGGGSGLEVPVNHNSGVETGAELNLADNNSVEQLVVAPEQSTHPVSRQSCSDGDACAKADILESAALIIQRYFRRTRMRTHIVQDCPSMNITAGESDQQSYKTCCDSSGEDGTRYLDDTTTAVNLAGSETKSMHNSSDSQQHTTSKRCTVISHTEVCCVAKQAASSPTVDVFASSLQPLTSCGGRRIWSAGDANCKRASHSQLSQNRRLTCASEVCYESEFNCAGDLVADVGHKMCPYLDTHGRIRTQDQTNENSRCADVLSQSCVALVHLQRSEFKPACNGSSNIEAIGPLGCWQCSELMPRGRDVKNERQSAPSHLNALLVRSQTDTRLAAMLDSQSASWPCHPASHELMLRAKQVDRELCGKRAEHYVRAKQAMIAFSCGNYKPAVWQAIQASACVWH